VLAVRGLSVGVAALLIATGAGAPGEVHAATAAIVRTQVDLGTLGGASSFPVAINNAGEIAGWSNPKDSTDVHAFRWDSTSGMTDLGTLGGPSSVAVAVQPSPTPPHPLTLAPGQSGVITVTFNTASASPAVDHGTLFVDTFSTSTLSGDELVGIPYTIG
jgi:probable HAF family extracellular repeat protein